MDDPISSDYHNFTQDSPSTHRLPTINGSDALLSAIEKHKPISTGLGDLDCILSVTDTPLSLPGGIPRGSVTEVYGPPGCGKSQFALQLVANLLKDEPVAEVTWIDVSSYLPLARLHDLLGFESRIESAEAPANGNDEPDVLTRIDRFNHSYIPDFTQLLAMLIHPPQLFPTPETRLMILDDFSSSVMSGLPQTEYIGVVVSTNSAHLSREEIMAKSIATRRATMLGAVSAGLVRLAAARNIAVVVLNKASSGRRSGDRTAVLRSILNTPQWNDSIYTRIAIYRDFWPAEYDLNESLDYNQATSMRDLSLRVAEVERLAGRDIRSHGVKFVILKEKLQAVLSTRNANLINTTLPASSPPIGETNEEAMGLLGLADAEEAEDQSLQMPEDAPPSFGTQALPMKRKIAEVADSEDEDDTGLSPNLVVTTAAGFVTSTINSKIF